ncbi:sugar transferase [Cohnella cholangitidis]|uniref:Sugar transferase n=1 Tax=Cohnella cholangitidis TaxID=2598458 RepID=A0A7G5C1Y6_9BACL|nr:sugar transferase [Cohnella cholangitidis]QMV43220.1 sugar transferase [Cohnella cholangitidis]
MLEASQSEVVDSSFVSRTSSVGTVRSPDGFYVHFMKPCMDISFALVLLLLVLPLCVVIGVAIKLDSKGAVFFMQERYGKNGNLFRIYKFRTMHSNVPKEGRSPDSKNDPRVTRVGRILRRTSLDEIPQLLNILRGEMSFIGPRPEQKSIVDQNYTSLDRQRFMVTPGITGLWQISPDRIAPIHENLHHDYEYIREISIVTDMKIIYRTLKVMIKSNTH